MKTFARLRAFSLSALLALSPFLASGAVAQTATYQLLNNASATGAIFTPSAGNYLLTIGGTFGGATLTLTETQEIGGATITLGTWTSAPTTSPCILVPGRASLRMAVAGGAPSGLYATLGGVGSASCSASSITGGGDASAANQVTGNNSLASIATNTTGVSTAAKQDTGNTSLASIATNTTGASTAAKQDTGNTSLASIATNTTGGATAANQATANTSLGQIHTDTGTTLHGDIGETHATPGSDASKADAVQGCTTCKPVGVAQGAATAVSATLQSAVTANGNGTSLTTTGEAEAVLTVNCATCSGGTTVNFEGTQDGTNFAAIYGIKLGTTTASTTVATAGVTLWQVPVIGLASIRARVSGYSAGTVTVTGNAVPIGTMDPASAAVASAIGAVIPQQVGTNIVGGVGLDATNNLVKAPLYPNILLPSSTQTQPATTTAYTALDLIANNATAGSITVSSLSITNSGGTIQRIRLSTNDATSTAWGGKTIYLDLWSAAPTFTNGDNGVYAVATGAGSHIAQFTCLMSAENGDGAFAECTPVYGSVVTVNVGTVYWSLESKDGSGVTGASKVWTAKAEILN